MTITRPRRVQWPLLAFLMSASLIAVTVLTRLPVPVPDALRGAGFFDLKIYRQAAGIVLDGGSLYRARFRLGLGFTYPPAAAVLFVALRLVGLRIDEILVTLANLGLIAVLAHLALRLAPGPADPASRSRRARTAWLAAAAAPWTYPMVGAIGFGQIDLLIASLVLVDLTVGRRARWGGLLVGVAAALKLTPLVFVPYLLLTGRRRMAARALGAFALSIALSFDVVPGDARGYWTGGVFDTSRVTGGHNTGRGPGDQSLHGAVLRLWMGLPHVTVIWVLACVLVGGAGLALAVRAARRGDEGWGFALTAITGLLVSPISWPHHWVILAPALVLCLDWAHRRARSRAAAVAVGTGVVLAAAGSWVLAPVIVAHPVGVGLGLGGLLVGDSYVLAGVATLIAAAVVDIRVVAGRRDAVPPSPSSGEIARRRVAAISGSSRRRAPVASAGGLSAGDRQSRP